MDNVYIRPPNTDSQSRGSRLSILPAGRHGARQAMVFVLFCWRLDIEYGGRNTASHQQPCIRSLAIFFRYLIKLVGHPFGWIALDFFVDLLFCYILGLLFHTLLRGNYSLTGCRPYILPTESPVQRQYEELSFIIKLIYIAFNCTFADAMKAC